MHVLVFRRLFLPLDSTDDNQSLECVAADVVACARRGDHGSQGDPAAEPETAGEQLDERNSDLM